MVKDTFLVSAESSITLDISPEANAIDFVFRDEDGETESALRIKAEPFVEFARLVKVAETFIRTAPYVSEDSYEYGEADDRAWDLKEVPF